MKETTRMKTTGGAAVAAVIVAISAIFMAGCGEQAQTGVSVEGAQDGFKDLDERFSYAYGADLAQRFKLEGIELNAALLAAGMKDVYSGGDRKMSAGEVAATVDLYLQIHHQRKAEERAALGEKNLAEGQTFLADNAKKEGVVVTESGLQYRVLTAGTGKYQPAENDQITVHYRASFVDGTEFDSTYERNQPYTARVLQLMDGWFEAIQLMTEGAKWELFVPAELAYGEEGSQHVGPNAVLIFEVELLEIEKYVPEVDWDNVE